MLLSFVYQVGDARTSSLLDVWTHVDDQTLIFSTQFRFGVRSSLLTPALSMTPHSVLTSGTLPKPPKSP